MSQREIGGSPWWLIATVALLAGTVGLNVEVAGVLAESPAHTTCPPIRPTMHVLPALFTMLVWMLMGAGGLAAGRRIQMRRATIRSGETRRASAQLSLHEDPRARLSAVEDGKELSVLEE